MTSDERNKILQTIKTDLAGFEEVRRMIADDNPGIRSATARQDRIIINLGKLVVALCEEQR